MLSHRAGNRPESTTEGIFRPVVQVAAAVGRQTWLFGRDRQVAVPGGGGRSLPSKTASGLREC